MRPGDRALFYHSGKNPSVVGTVRVARAGYPDHTAWDAESGHHDPRSTPEAPVWYMVDIRLDEVFEEPLTLASLKAIPDLKDMVLLRKGSRLSVQPVTPREFEVVLSLAKRVGGRRTVPKN
jgi:predicted RNA-binding protein with PUA-like domain